MERPPDGSCCQFFRAGFSFQPNGVFCPGERFRKGNVLLKGLLLKGLLLKGLVLKGYRSGYRSKG